MHRRRSRHAVRRRRRATAIHTSHVTSSSPSGLANAEPGAGQAPEHERRRAAPPPGRPPRSARRSAAPRAHRWPGGSGTCTARRMTHLRPHRRPAARDRGLRARGPRAQPSSRGFERAHDDRSTCAAAARRAWARTSPTTPDEQAAQQDRGPGARRSPASGRSTRSRAHLGDARPLPGRRRPSMRRLPPLPPLGVRERGARPRAAPGRPLARTTCSGASRARSRSSSRCGIGEPPTHRAGRRAGSRATRGCASSSTRTPDWDDELIEQLVDDRRGRLDRLQGRLQGHGGRRRRPTRRSTAGSPRRSPTPGSRTRTSTDPEAARRARAVPDRITWDAPIHSVADIDALAVPAAHGQPQAVALRLGARRCSRPTTSASRARHRAPTAAASTSSASAAARSSASRRSSIPTAPNDIAPVRVRLGSSSRAGPRAEPARSRTRRHRLPPADVDSRDACRPSRARSASSQQVRARPRCRSSRRRSDEELEAETRFRAAAQAILGARAAERMDAKRSREHFRAAIAAARPQERLQLRRMAEASLALAERRAGRPQGRRPRSSARRRRPTASC